MLEAKSTLISGIPVDRIGIIAFAFIFFELSLKVVLHSRRLVAGLLILQKSILSFKLRFKP